VVKGRDWRLERTWERSDVEEVFLCLYVHIRTFEYGFGYGFRRAQLSLGGRGVVPEQGS
jgi:hypothetical protein